MTQDQSPPGHTPSDPSPQDHANVLIRPPILWALLVAAGIGLDFLAPLPFMPAGLPAPWIGAGVWLAGFGLAVIVLRQFRRAKTDVHPNTPTAVIVETGLFAFSRNPIYLGGHIGLAGVAIAFDSLWVLLMLVPFYLVIRYGVVAREEAYLEREFGEAYLAYKARVRRWL